MEFVVGLDSLVCLLISYHELVEFVLIKGYIIDSDFDVSIEQFDTSTRLLTQKTSVIFTVLFLPIW